MLRTKTIIKKLLAFFVIFTPWQFRRWILNTIFHYKIHSTSRIGIAWICPQKLILEAHSHIGHFTVCKGLSLLYLKKSATIGKANWVTGYPIEASLHYKDQKNRKPQLVIGEHSAITNRHIIDCTNSVNIGKFTIIAGFKSQILTHRIDLELCKQWSAPITIGDYCFVGTDCVLLGGSSLPSYSILGAKSLLNKSFSEEYYLYTGVPAKPTGKVSRFSKYFSRANGYVI